jgi:hypothetical protein
MGLSYWGDGNPFYVPGIDTGGLDYWGDGAPLSVLGVDSGATGTAEATLSPIIAAATGEHIAYVGAGAGTIPAAIGQASGVQRHTGAAAGTLPLVQGAASGWVGVTSVPSYGPELLPDPDLEGTYNNGICAAFPNVAWMPLCSQSADAYSGVKAQQFQARGPMNAISLTYQGTVGKKYRLTARAKKISGDAEEPVSIGFRVGIVGVYQAIESTSWQLFELEETVYEDSTVLGIGVYQIWQSMTGYDVVVVDLLSITEVLPNATLPALVGAATGEVPVPEVTGTGAGILPGITGDAIGTQGARGTVAGVAPAITGLAAGSQGATGTGAGITPAIIASAHGVQRILGAGAGVLGAIIGAATGAQGARGDAEGVVPSPEALAAGNQGVVGTGAGVLPPLAAAADGYVIQGIGAGAGVVGPVTGDAAGYAWVAGAGAGVIPGASGDARGARGAAGTAHGDLHAITGQAEGVYILPVFGVGTASVPALHAAVEGLMGEIPKYLKIKEIRAPTLHAFVSCEELRVAKITTPKLFIRAA